MMMRVPVVPTSMALAGWSTKSGVPLYGGNGGGTCVDRLVLEDLTECLLGTWWLQK